MKDGLYRIDYKNICAGFIVKDDKIIKCAPILRKKILFWKTIAKLIKS